jgi:hypothetical protein
LSKTVHLFSTNPDNKLIQSGYLYVGRSGTDEINKFNESLHDPNQTVYVGYGDSDKARYGSIGIAVPKGYDPEDRESWPSQRPPAPVLPGRYSYYKDYVSRDDMDVHWDKKHQMLITSYDSGIYWLTTHTGPTKWVFTRKTAEEKKKAAVQAYDKLMNEVNVGDFVAFVARSTYSTSKGDLMFGFVDKVTPAGVMMCKNIKLSDSDTVGTWRVGKGEQITKLSKEILNQLMLRRLTF